MSAVSAVGDFQRASSAWMDEHGVRILRYSLAGILFWFGLLKPLSVSPAEPIVRQAIFFFPHDIFFPFLGWWEAVIGVGMLFDRTLRISVFMLVVQMLGTMIPLLVTPAMTFAMLPVVPTEIGVFIIKNWVLLTGGLVVAHAAQEDSI